MTEAPFVFATEFRGRDGRDGRDGVNGLDGSNVLPTDTVIGRAPGKLAVAGGGAVLWSDAFIRTNRALVADTAPTGVRYTQHGSFNTQNFAPKIVGGRYVIDPAASSWAGWSFALMVHSSDFDGLAAEFGYIASVLGSPTSTQECVLVASAVKPTLSNLSVQFAVSPTGWHLFKIMGGQRVPVGSVGYLSSSLSTSGPITSIPVTGGTFGGSTRGITQAIPAGTFTLVSNDGTHTQTWATTGAAVGDTAIPVTSQTPNFAYSGTAPVAAVILGSPASGVGNHATPLAQDNATRWQSSMRLDRTTSTVTCAVNGVVVGSWTDPDFVSFWGRQAAVQLLRGTTTGDVWCTALATLGAPAPTTGAPSPASIPYLTGDTGTYLSTPAPAWPVATTGALVVVADVTPDLWQSGATQVIASQWGGNDCSWWFGMPSTGGKKLQGGLSVTGVAANVATVLSSTAHTLTDGTRALVAMSFDPAAAGVSDVKFYTSTTLTDADKKVDNSDGGSWSQLGTAVSSGLSGTLWQSAQAIRVGNRNTTSTLPYKGYVYYVRTNDAVGGTLLADPDWRGAFSGLDLVGNRWTSTGSGLAYRVPASSVIVVATATTTALAAIGNSINTADKYAGRRVWNTTTHKTVTANGSAAGDVWYDETGSVAHTPV